MGGHMRPLSGPRTQLASEATVSPVSTLLSKLVTGCHRDRRGASEVRPLFPGVRVGQGPGQEEL